MKLSIRSKLGIGFGVVIALMAVSSTIAYINLQTMNRTVGKLVDDAVPTVRACDRLRSGLNESLASLRGYMILGDTPRYSRSFRDSREQAWQSIDRAMTALERHVRVWNNATLTDHLAELKRVASELRETQQLIESTVHTDDNIASYHLLTVRAAPRAEAALQELTHLINAEKLQDATPERKSLLAALADNRGSLARCLAGIRAYTLAGEPQYKQAFNEQWSINQAALDELLRMSHLFTPIQADHWEVFLGIRSEFAPLPEQIFALRDAADWNRAEFWLERDAAPQVDTLRRHLLAITNEVDLRNDERRAALDTASQVLALSFLLGTLAAVLIGSLFAIFFSRKIVDVLRTLAARAQKISEGDLTSNRLLSKSSDELGQLADGFDKMLENLKDLTGQILCVTENVNSATSQISSSAKQQATSTKEQATTVQEINSTMQEIAQSGSQIVDKAKQVAAAAEAAARQSESGFVAVQNTSQTMQSIREQVEEVAEHIGALSEKTQAVSEIVATVDSIAEQSNLLALNATIEAVEAGEGGRRFAVVANEMKNLADHAKECTVQVRTILGDIHKGINSAVMLTEEAVKRVESGKQQADISEDAIRTMWETTNDSIQAFQQIIGATNQQQIGFEQVTQGMQDIDQATQQAASETAQLEQALVGLSAMSEQLKSAVSAYKLQA